MTCFSCSSIWRSTPFKSCSNAERYDDMQRVNHFKTQTGRNEKIQSEQRGYRTNSHNSGYNVHAKIKTKTYSTVLSFQNSNFILEPKQNKINK